MLCCDDIIRTTVGAVLAAHLSLSTATLLVFSHGAALYSLTTTKGARQEDVVTLVLVGIKMALEVPHLSCPPTAFTVVLAVYLEVVDLALEELVEASAGQNVGFATLWALLLAVSEESCATLSTKMMTTVIQEWLGQQLKANGTETTLWRFSYAVVFNCHYEAIERDDTKKPPKSMSREQLR